MGMGMGIEQWEWEGMGIPIVFPHTSRLYPPSDLCTALVLRRFLQDCWTERILTELSRQTADSTWARIEKVWFKLLKSVRISGYGAKCHFLVGPSHTKSNRAYGVKRMSENVNPSINKTAFSQNAAPGWVSKELTNARSCMRRSTHSIAILEMLGRLVQTVLH